MRKILYILMFILMPMIFMGCASGAKYADMQTSIPALGTDSGRIFIYRTSVLGAAVQPDVFLNDEKVGKAVPGGFFYLDRKPGEYQARASTEVKRSVSFTVEPGQIRYIRLDISMGFAVGHVSPVLVGEDKAKKEIQGCKYSGS